MKRKVITLAVYTAASVKEIRECFTLDSENSVGDAAAQFACSITEAEAYAHPGAPRFKTVWLAVYTAASNEEIRKCFTLDSENSVGDAANRFVCKITRMSVYVLRKTQIR